MTWKTWTEYDRKALKALKDIGRCRGESDENIQKTVKLFQHLLDFNISFTFQFVFQLFQPNLACTKRHQSTLKGFKYFNVLQYHNISEPCCWYMIDIYWYWCNRFWYNAYICLIYFRNLKKIDINIPCLIYYFDIYWYKLIFVWYKNMMIDIDWYNPTMYLIYAYIICHMFDI